ncbi:MAG: hypothetical protein A2017_20835 [Lentisphaerae bacterium GWF2_44_16]|nr:MAG: hypothetical protein A2017_20835 [Lentisphaerae bacterium GWF2_44_16]
MTWKAYNTAVRIPTLRDNVIDQTKTIYIGIDDSDDEGYKLFYHSGLSKWVIAAHWGMSFIISGYYSGTCPPDYVNYNGYSSYTKYSSLWYDLTYGWVVTLGNLGAKPIEYWRPNDPINDPSGAGTYQGTVFYTGTPPALGGSAAFQARGNIRGSVKNAYSGTAITLTTQYQRWESATLYGEYTAAGGASGIKYCGLPQWTDGDGNTYIRSVTKTDGKYTYGTISYNTTYSKWLIGAYGSASGWYEGSEPSKTGSVTFTFKVPEGSEITGTNKTVTFDKYVKGENTQTVFLTEASRWI